MRISKNYEQGIYVLLLLATQKDHQPLKSGLMSQLLGVSDSSLKKILRKLVVKELIESTASKDGGFNLKKSIDEITLLDVLHAIEDDRVIKYTMTHLAQSIFPNKKQAFESENLVIQTITRGEQAFSAELAKVNLGELIDKQSIRHGAIDWTKSDLHP